MHEENHIKQGLILKTKRRQVYCNHDSSSAVPPLSIATTESKQICKKDKDFKRSIFDNALL